MGRLYHGAWRLLYTYVDEDGKLQQDMTDPVSYEECEVECRLIGLGFPLGDRIVRSAKIIGPSPWVQTDGLVV